MEIRTFTSFWNMERKLYSIYDVSLPMPISLKVAGAFFVAGIPWWFLMGFLQVPFLHYFTFWLLPPVALGYIASKPIFQRKTFTEFLLSQIAYLRQPKRLAGFRTPDYEFEKKYRLKIRIFTRTPKDLH